MKEGLDWIARGIANAATDIRHKVVEEPWFGRVVTPEPGQALAPDERSPDRDPTAWWRGREVMSPEPESDDLTHTQQHRR